MRGEKFVSHGVFTVGPLVMSVVLLLLSILVCLIDRILRPSLAKRLFPLSLLLFAIIEFFLLFGMFTSIMGTSTSFKF